MQERIIFFLRDYYCLMFVFCTVLNSFTQDEYVENNIEKSDNRSFCPYDLLIQGDDLPMAWTKMPLPPQLFSICT